MSNTNRKTITQHFDKPVSMTTASGYDEAKTRGFSVEVTLWDDEDGLTQGAWEICSDDESCYGEGCLEFDGKKCTGYDGCFDLSQMVCDMLKEAGYDVTEVDSRLF